MSGDGGQFISYYNDFSPLTTTAVSGSTMWSTSTDTYVGNRSDFNQPYNGNLSQIVAFNQQLLGADLANVQQSLSDKWSLGVNFGGDAAAGNILLQEPPTTLVEAVNAANYMVTDVGAKDDVGDSIIASNYAPAAGRYFGTASEGNDLGFFVFELPVIPVGQELSGADLTAFLNSNSATVADGTLNMIGTIWISSRFGSTPYPVRFKQVTTQLL